MIQKVMLKNVYRLRQFFTNKNIVIFIFALYFVIGMFIFNDYGVSTDEPQERLTSLANYVYVFERLMAASDQESVQNVLRSTPELMTLRDRYYGVALQTLTVLVEHFHNFEMGYREIFLMRHAFTFLNYFMGGIFFYLILHKRFGDSFIPVMGLLFYILYPRFFGESFYNIKDILFYSWCIIASYFVLRWLENEQKDKFVFPAAITLAVATNTRILGISILLLACGFAFLQGLSQKERIQLIIKKCCNLSVLTFIFYVVITPFTWENPIKNTIDIFFHFLRFQPWNGTHFYLGEMITREVPWHYIPVWMGVTIPLIYILMFFVGFATILALGFIKLNKKNKAIGELHLYDMFFAAMFICTLLGFILLRISMYEGWRHAYNLFLPFLYVAVYGLSCSFNYFQQRRKILRYSFVSIVTISLIHLLIWITASHPYQFVYFNIVGRQFAERNFALDYWYVSHADLVRYALNHSDASLITIGLNNNRPLLTLTEEERRRIAMARSNSATEFYIRGSRLSYERRTQDPGFFFHEVTSIEVDGMRIATLFQRVIPFSVDLDLNVWDKVSRFESNVDENFRYLYDGNYFTRWTTGRPQESEDYMMFEFGEVVDFNYIHLNPGRSPSDYPIDLAIYTSIDGVVWQNEPILKSVAQSHFVFESQDYYFLKLVNRGASARYHWSVVHMSFGHVTE